MTLRPLPVEPCPKLLWRQRLMQSEKHVCQESKTCCCYLLALEPDENCPIHGYPWPPRCEECGRFIRRNLGGIRG